jgi:hypothetical protein
MKAHAETFVHAVIAGDKEQAEQAFRGGLSEKARAALEVRKLALVDQVFNSSKAPQQAK